jgi:hypothetical protein
MKIYNVIYSHKNGVDVESFINKVDANKELENLLVDENFDENTEVAEIQETELK